MGKNNMKKEELNILVMIFCIVGVVLTVLGFLLIKNANFRLNVFKTEATVTSLQTATLANGEEVSRVLVLSYNASKSPYTANLYVPTDDTTKIGDKIDLYYDFLQPSSVTRTRTGYWGYISLILGIIFVLKTGPKFIRIVRDNYL